MQRILSVYDSQLLPVDSRMVIESDIPGMRLVRMRVKCPTTAALYVEQEGIVDPIFLTTVTGLDEIEFHIDGSYKMFATGEIWFDTLDGTKADVEPVDQTSFTNIVERQARNPEMELIERKMQENIERRMALLTTAMGQMLEQKESELVATRAIADDALRAARELNAGQPAPVVGTEPPAGPTGGEPDGQ